MSATAAAPHTTKLAAERRFFLYAAVAIFVLAIAGFGSDVFARHVWFSDFPWQVHIHATLFSSWIVLYLVQNWLVADGRNVMLHRRLGWLGAGLAALMVPVGIAATVMAIVRGSITGMFPLGLFLAMDVLGILGFGGLTLAAILLRNHAGWHKRLMLSGTVLVIAPALARLAALPPIGDLVPVVVIGVMLLFFSAGILFDRIVLRRIHPAYWWGMGIVLLVQIVTGPIGFSPPVVAFATWLAG